MKTLRIALLISSFGAIGTAQAQAASKDKKAPESKPIAQSCFTNNNRFLCSVRADNDPKSQAASKPAAFSYVKSKDSSDSYAIQVAVKGVYAVKDAFITGKSSLNRNNQISKKQESFQASLGLHVEPSNIEAAFDRWQKDKINASTDFWTANMDLDVGYSQSAIFANKKDTACVASPSRRACTDQDLQSLRITATAAPYYTRFESEASATNSSIYYLFSPTLGAFVDHALNDNIELLSGKRVNGTVAGVMGGASLSVLPRAFAAKWELLITGQFIQTLKRSAEREATFAKNPTLFTVGISRALGANYVGEKTANKWLPAVSATYKNGSDPLVGLAKQENLTFGLTIKY